MGIFNSIKKSRRASSDIDEKIEYLNKELEKTGLREGMTTSNIYVNGARVPNQAYNDFNGLSQGGYALGLSADEGDSLGGAIIGINPSTNQPDVALSPPHPVLGTRRAASTVISGTGSNRSLRPGKGTRVRGTNDDGTPRVIKDGSAVWFWDSNYNFSGQQGRWLNFEWLDGQLGFWDTNFLGFFFHNTNLDDYVLSGVNIGTQIKNKLAGINFGANGSVGTPQTLVLQKNDLGDPSFLPINIDGLSPQGFDYLKDKAGRNRRGSGMRDRGREGGNFSGDQQSNKRSGVGNAINSFSGITGTRLDQYGAMIAAKSTIGAMDNIIYGGSGHLIKGLSKGRLFNKSFKGAGPSSGIAGKIFRGKKLVDWGDSIINGSVNMISRAVGGKGGFAPNILRNVVGKNYAGQWFTDPTRLNVAKSYAGKGGTISIVPRTAGKFGWKNWLGSNTSRSLAMQPETFQRTEDILNVMEGGTKTLKGFGKNAQKVGGARINLDIDNPKTQKLLKKYAAKVATNSKTLKTIARGIPLLGAGISAADAAHRFSTGDWKGGALSIASMVPGPVGWFALGSQVAVDTGALEKAIEFGYNSQTGFNPDTGTYEPRTMGSSADRRAARGGGNRNQYGQNVSVDNPPPAKPSGNAETSKIDLEIANIEVEMSGSKSQYEKNRLNQQLSRAKQRLQKAYDRLDVEHERNVQDWDKRRASRGSGYEPPKSNEGDLPGDNAPGADVPAVNTSREVDGRVEYNRGLRTDPDGREYYEILTYPKGGSLYSGNAYTFRSYKGSTPPVKDSSDPGMPSNPDFRGPGNNKDFKSKPKPKPLEKDYERNRRRNRPRLRKEFNDYMLDGNFLVEEKQEQYTNANMDELKDEMRKAGIPIDNPEEMADQFGLASLAAGMNPEIVEIIQLAIVGAELTPKQEKDISQSMMEFSGVMYANEKAEQISGKNTNELADEDDDEQVKESYITEDVGLGHFEPEQLNVDIEDLRKGIMPEFPKDPPPEMVDGYNPKSRLAPKELERSSFIKITKKDLAKNHRLKDSEIKDFMDTINAVNEFIKKHPEELIYAQTRYPKNDPRLAQLNWEMDQKLNASKEYMDKHYPENQKLFTKVQKSIKKNIELTDPKSFKGVKVPKFKGVDLTDFKRRKEVVARHYKKAVKTKKLFSRKKT